MNQILNSMNTTTISLFCLLAILRSISFSLAQTPFTGSLNGRPNAYDANSDRAYVIGTNTDGSANSNEFLYFKVYTPGGGSNWNSQDWYTNPTAWLDDKTFHFNNVNLKMYNNSIQLNKRGILEFGTDQIKGENSGKIGYGTFAPGLNIVGGNSVTGSVDSKDRRLVVFAEGGSIFNGPVGLTTAGDGSMTLPKNLSNGADLTNYRLFVSGGILAKEIRVNTSNWADYVFAPNYKLKSLVELEEQIAELGHLPDMPSAKEIETNGFSMSEIACLQQEKIEELTLYVIALKKQLDQLTKKGRAKK